MKAFTKELIELAAKGDQFAIADLYQLTYDSVYKAAKALIRDDDAVLDIVQDSYIKAFQSLEQLDAPENFRAWVTRIAVNKAKDHLKKKRPVLFSEMASEDGEEVDFQDECLSHLPEAVLDRKETTRLMDEILSTLSDDQRMTLGLHYYQEMSIKEIALLMGCSENTVKSRLNYGRKKVEIQVRELEKKGTKLYSLAPLPFLLWLLRMYAQIPETPSKAVLAGITANCAAGSAAAVGSGAVAAGNTAAAGAVAGSAANAVIAKIVAGILAVGVLGGGAAILLAQGTNHNQTSSPTDVAGTTASPATGSTEFQITAQEAYQAVLAQYRTALEAENTEFLRDPAQFYNGDHAAVGYYHMYHQSTFHYAFCDIDGNGVDELLLGIGYEGEVTPVDLYGFDLEKAVQLIDDPALGDSASLAVLGDGTLQYTHMDSNATSVCSWLKLDGIVLTPAQAPSFAEAAQIPWQQMQLQRQPQTIPPHDSILAEIREALTVPTDRYDADTAYYDSKYAHLGEGMMWMLMHREAGSYTMCIWSSFADVNGDGQQELCIGRGTTPERANLIAVYSAAGEAILGDAVFAYEDIVSTLSWDYLGG